MISKAFLKKIGMLSVSFGLVASPLVIADMHEGEVNGDTVGDEVQRDVDPTSPEADVPNAPGGDPAGIDEGTADPATGEPGTGAEPDAGMPDEEEAGFGDGGEAMPGSEPSDGGPEIEELETNGQ